MQSSLHSNIWTGRGLCMTCTMNLSKADLVIVVYWVHEPLRSAWCTRNMMLYAIFSPCWLNIILINVILSIRLKMSRPMREDHLQSPVERESALQVSLLLISDQELTVPRTVHLLPSLVVLFQCQNSSKAQPFWKVHFSPPKSSPGGCTVQKWSSIHFSTPLPSSVQVGVSSLLPPLAAWNEKILKLPRIGGRARHYMSKGNHMKLQDSSEGDTLNEGSMSVTFSWKNNRSLQHQVELLLRWDFKAGSMC